MPKGKINFSINKYYIFFLLLLILVSFYSVNTIPIGVDNGNVYIQVKFFGDVGFEKAYSNLVSIIPVILYSVLEVFDIPLLLLSSISTIMFIICIYLIIKLLFKSSYSIILIFLFPIVFERSFFLSPYPLFMFLFTLCMYLFMGAIQSKKEKLYVFSALFLSLSIYTFMLPLMLSIIPFFYLICYQSTSANKIKIFIRYYTYVISFLIPWIYWHFDVGGLKYFYYSNINWYILKALPIVNENFWGYGSIYYPALLQQYLNQFIPNVFLPFFLIFIMFAIPNYNKFKTIINFSVLYIIFYIPTLLLFGVSAFSRYFYPLVVPLVLIGSIGLVTLHDQCKGKTFVLLALIILIIGIFNFNTSYFSNSNIETRFKPSSDNSFSDFKDFKNLIDDNKKIFARHYAFQYYFGENYFISQTDMSEEDVLKLITWSSDEDVKNVLKKYNIGWVVLYNNEIRWEHDYYVWVNILHGGEPKHFEEIKNADYFRQVKVGKIYTLYKFVNNTN